MQSLRTKVNIIPFCLPQRDILDLCITISDSYHFEFQKIKTIKVQNFEILSKFVYNGRYLTENTSIVQYSPIQNGIERCLTSTNFDINLYRFLTDMV